MFWKTSVMWLPLLSVSCGNSSWWLVSTAQEIEVQAKITVFTGSVSVLLRLTDRYRPLWNPLSSRALWVCVRSQTAVRSQSTALLMPGHRFFRANYCPFRFLILCWQASTPWPYPLPHEIPGFWEGSDCTSDMSGWFWRTGPCERTDSIP